MCRAGRKPSLQKMNQWANTELWSWSHGNTLVPSTIQHLETEEVTRIVLAQAPIAHTILTTFTSFRGGQ